MKVLVTDFAWPSLDIERDILAEAGADLVVSARADDLGELARDADAILINWRQLPPAVLDAAPRCRAVVRYGVGTDNIPVARATELGIVVANVPDYCVDEVAEHTIALLLAGARSIVDFARLTRAGGWDNQAFGPLRRLSGQTLGVVGYGRLGQAVAGRAAALGMHVVATSRTRTGTDGHARFVSLDELLTVSDHVSLHLPLTAETHHVIGGPQLDRMKPTARLVNTARGGLVDMDALVARLRSGRLAGAAVDVLDAEPPPADHPLCALDTVILTPHAAFYSIESINALQAAAAERVAAALRGDEPRDVVNPQVLPTARIHRRDR